MNQFIKRQNTLDYLESRNDFKDLQSKIKSIRISLASPEDIMSWSNGEITKPETINYKSLKPERGGLFDEVIFGPTKNYECYCGKYKKVKYRGKKCEHCQVEITESIVRRERMGHIKLAAPVAHMWMIKELPLPSKISLILGMSYKQVEEVVYFINHIVLDPGFYKDKEGKPLFELKEVINLSDSKSKSGRSKIRKLLRMVCEEIAATSELGKKDPNYIEGWDYYNAFESSNLPYSVHEMFAFLNKQTGLRVGYGAEAILELLQNIDLEELEQEISNELNTISKNDSYINNSDTKVKKLLRRLSVIRNLKNSGNKPEWMILKVIPVIPPDLRPIIQLEGGKFTTSDINTFYRRIIIRNQRLAKMLEINAFPLIVDTEKRMLQEAVDSLIDNGSRKKPLVSKDKHLLKSLTQHLKGKQGLFRQNLLGKRVDYSGRSVIVIGPNLKMYEVGLPIIMILKLFKPFIIHELTKNRDQFGNEIKPKASSIKQAEKMILRQSDEIWPIVQKVIKERPVLLNRAPTLHRLGIQAFEPTLVEGKAIRLHPLVTTAFNADFDGDQMAVHMPISDEAVSEARSILLAPWHILGPKDGKPVITPTQDMILGIYYLTLENKKALGTGKIFATKEEALNAYALKKVDLHAIIGIDTAVYPQKQFVHQGILMTTVGKILLNDVFPIDFNYINEKYPTLLNDKDIVGVDGYYKTVEDYLAAKTETPAFNKNVLSKLIDLVYEKYASKTIPEVLDRIKDLAFEYSMRSSVTVSAFDVPIYDKKQDLFDQADKEVAKQKELFNQGLLTDDERYKKVISIWNKVKDKVAAGIKEMMNQPEHKDNSIMIMAESGARGNVSNFTQLSGMRGLMNKSYNYEQKTQSNVIHDVIEVPIKHSFIEGLTVTECFNSSYGARKGMTDTAMKTSKSGYMTRKLVDAAQEIIVKSVDCGTKKGLVVSDIKDIKEGQVTEKLQERILNRFSNRNYYDKETNELIIGKDQLITEEIATKLAKQFDEIEVRSILCCLQHQGVCQKCFGSDLTTKKPIAEGTAIGVIAAQSIGEPGTQLTMRTFHSGGVAGESNITQGFERLKQLFEMITPKEWEKAQIAEISGKIESITANKNGSKIVKLKSWIDERSYDIDINAVLRVQEGDYVEAGQKITEGSIDPRQLLKISGIEAVCNYLIKEVQKVYRLQGIEIADKYIEVIIRQLTKKVQIQNPNDSDLAINDILDLSEFTKICTKLLIDKKTPPTAVNIIFGLDEAPSKTNSFLSAASFQDTKKILTDAAIKGQTDYLHSLKENVIMGNLIPAGTGLKTSQEVIEDGRKIGKFSY